MLIWAINGDDVVGTCTCSAVGGSLGSLFAVAATACLLAAGRGVHLMCTHATSPRSAPHRRRRHHLEIVFLASATNQSASNKYARATARVMPTHADGQAGGGGGGAKAKPTPKLDELAAVQKRVLLLEHDKGMPLSGLAEKFNISRRTATRINKERAKWMSVDAGTGKRDKQVARQV